MNITDFTKLINNYMIEARDEYSSLLNKAIDNHNHQVASVSVMLQSSSVIALLLEKGIITDEELASTMQTIFNSIPHKSIIESNRDSLLKIIEEEMNTDDMLK